MITTQTYQWLRFWLFTLSALPSYTYVLTWIYLFSTKLLYVPTRAGWLGASGSTSVCTGLATWHQCGLSPGPQSIRVPPNPRLWFGTWRSFNCQEFSFMGSFWRQFILDKYLCWRWQEGLMTKDSCQRKAWLPWRVSLSGRLVPNVGTRVVQGKEEKWEGKHSQVVAHYGML